MKRKEKEFLKVLEEIRKIAAMEGYDSLDETYVEHLKCRFFGTPVVIGRGAGVLLRELQMSDLESLNSFADRGEEPVLTAFLRETKEETREYLAAYIETMYPFYDYGIWAVERLSDSRVIGLCGLGRTRTEGIGDAELGYYICPECRNQGFASESVEIVLDYVKNYLEISVICAIIKEENRISQGVLRKFGFEYQRRYEKSGEKRIVYQKIMSES